MHSLFIPSWYPAQPGDTLGSFFFEQAAALRRADIEMGVFAMSLVPWYTKGFKATSWTPLGTVEDGVPVLRANVPQLVPTGRLINILAAGRTITSLFDAYVFKWGLPDVLHAHSLFPGAYVAAFLGKKYNLPYIITEHRSLDHLPVRSKIGQRLERNIVRSAASRHGVSRGQKNHLASRFDMNPDEWEYTPNLLPDVALNSLPTLRPRIGYTVGHLSILDPVKGIDVLIKAFADAFERDDDCRLIIAGDGEDKSRLQKIVEASGAADQIRFVGRIERDEVADFFASLDVSVLASYSEGFGVTLIESLAAGTPVIATKTWGGETVVEQPDGLLIEIGNREQLAEALRKMRDTPPDTDRRAKLRKRTIDRFGKEVFVRNYRNAYENAVATKSPIRF